MVARAALLVPFALASVALAQDVPPVLAEATQEEQYRVRPGADGTLEAANPAQGMAASFAPAGFQVSGPGWTLGLSLKSWGRECDQILWVPKTSCAPRNARSRGLSAS